MVAVVYTPIKVCYKLKSIAVLLFTNKAAPPALRSDRPHRNLPCGSGLVFSCFWPRKCCWEKRDFISSGASDTGNEQLMVRTGMNVRNRRSSSFVMLLEEMQCMDWKVVFPAREIQQPWNVIHRTNRLPNRVFVILLSEVTPIRPSVKWKTWIIV